MSNTEIGAAVGFALIVVVIALLVGVCLLSSFVLFIVWNALAHYFGFHTITFFIAICIDVALGFIGGVFRSIN